MVSVGLSNLLVIPRNRPANRPTPVPRMAAAAAAICLLLSALSLTAGAEGARQGPAPLQLLPERSLEDLFDYAPEYTQNIPTFDSNNRPYIRSRTVDLDETGFIHTLRDGKWVVRDFLPAIKQDFPSFKRTWRGGGWLDPRVVFDADDRLYTQVGIELTTGERINLLVYSTDFGETFGTVRLPDGAVIAEYRSGHNPIEGPPFVMIQKRLRPHRATYASWNQLSVTQPSWKEGKLTIPEPIVVSESLVGLEQHSGGSSFAVTRDGVTHFIWGEVTEKAVPEGMPICIATYSAASHTVTKPLELTRQPPSNNAHNMPGIVIDSGGFLHVVTGSHGGSFSYLRSIEPNDPCGGWTQPTAVLQDSPDGGRVRQTYVSLLCDADDTLHLVYRQWREDLESFPHLNPADGNYYGVLAWQRKPSGGPWTDPQPVIIPARAEYSIYYHRVSLDRDSRLFLSASYYDRSLLNQSAQRRYHHRMVLVSDKNGHSFHLAGTKDFQSRIRDPLASNSRIPVDRLHF